MYPCFKLSTCSRSDKVFKIFHLYFILYTFILLPNAFKFVFCHSILITVIDFDIISPKFTFRVDYWAIQSQDAILQGSVRLCILHL